MFNRKFSSNIRRRKRMITSTIILLAVFLSIGYSVFSTNLGINGTLDVSKYDQTLYGVLEKAAKKGTYAKEYTGNHQDSMAGVGTEKIYYWYGSNTANGIAITDMNNVIFANHCWQMIRTTDTGGVKMIYNGESENNQCLNTRGNHVGYSQRTTQSMSTTYYYGTSYTYDSTNNVFSLDGTITTGTIQTGQYTCKQTTSTGTCATLYLVDTLSSGTTYYVLPLNGSSNYSQFGALQFNQSYDSPAYAGYMYNIAYPIQLLSRSYGIANNSMQIPSSSYYCAESIDYGNIVANKYTLINPQIISSLSDNSELVGKYILTNGTNGSSTEAMYIIAIDGTRIRYRLLTDGDLATSITVGDSYIDNGNGTYTIDNPTVVSFVDWYSGSYSNLRGLYACDGTNSTCLNLKHITSAMNYYYNYCCIEDTFKYSATINYSNGTYNLTGDIKNIWDTPNENSNLSSHHYTCLTSGTACTTINYVSYTEGGQYYISMNNGENISTALANMLSVDNVNQIDSTIKTGIDAWYKRYMTEYANHLEDTIFCGNRTINSLGGWDPNGGDITSSLEFEDIASTTTLSCTNLTDKFSTLNSKAQLIYPVGLLTRSEVRLLGNTNLRKTGNDYWLIQSAEVNYARLMGFYVRNTGNVYYYLIDSSYGVRPVISLKPGTEYVSGTGSMADPYIVQ